MAGESVQTVTRTRIVTAAEVRVLTGYTKTADLNDPDMESLLDIAHTSILHEVAERVHGLPLVGFIDGQNTRFMLPPGRGSVVLDHTLNADEANDIKVFLRSRSTTAGVPPSWALATVASIDALHGVLTLDAAPSAATYDQAEFTGHLISASLDRDHLALPILYLAAHLTDRRIRHPGTTPLSNPNIGGRKDPVLTKMSGAGSAYYDLYRQELARVKSPRPRAASRRTALRGERDEPRTQP